MLVKGALGMSHDNFWWVGTRSKSITMTNFFRNVITMTTLETRPPLERRKTLGHLRSVNPNTINHYASQWWQTCQLLKVLKNFFFSNKENVRSGAINFRLNWYTKSISIIERSYIYMYYIYIHIYVEFFASDFNDLSKFIGRAIIEELSIRRRPRTFLAS